MMLPMAVTAVCSTFVAARIIAVRPAVVLGVAGCSCCSPVWHWP